MSNKLSKDRAFERTISKYWEKLVNGILVPGERGCAPSMGEILCAYNDMKSRQPKCKYVILKTEKSSSEYFQPGDKFGGIRIIRTFESVNASIEFILTGATYYVRLQGNEVSYHSSKLNYCDLSQTISNFENFIDKFPSYLEEIEKKKLEFEKKKKLEEMAKSSIQATVSQLLTPMGYRWELVERERDFLLKIGGHGTWIEFALNRKNFTTRVAELPDVLSQIELLTKKLTFSMNIAIKK